MREPSVRLSPLAHVGASDRVVQDVGSRHRRAGLPPRLCPRPPLTLPRDSPLSAPFLICNVRRAGHASQQQVCRFSEVTPAEYGGGGGTDSRRDTRYGPSRRIGFHWGSRSNMPNGLFPFSCPALGLAAASVCSAGRGRPRHQPAFQEVAGLSLGLFGTHTRRPPAPSPPPPAVQSSTPSWQHPFKNPCF